MTSRQTGAFDEWAQWSSYKRPFGRVMLLAAFEWAFMFGQMAESAWHIKEWFGL